eukprot:TRINITY_DN47791_c0_g1_i1.p1 TRINITY_DN47791_c0_g1~~TRINITY_DN47791_c0_g1_i1.p1  ORF type:complete len:357 (+),score=70.07 TRINITY_DN47791_c0_g1_i1:74-1144(+)
MWADRQLCKDIWRVLESGELNALKAITPANFDWRSARCPTSGSTALQTVVCGVFEDTKSYKRRKAVAAWLIDQGASPVDRADGSAGGFFVFRGAEDWEERKIVVERKGRSALSLAIEIRTKLQEQEGDAEEDDAEVDTDLDFGAEEIYLTELIEIFSSPDSSMHSSSRTTVNTSVVERWAAMLQDTKAGCVDIKAADGTCTVHASMLMCASPVLKALLHTPMQEGLEKSIAVTDCPLAAVNFLMELMYTGGSSEDVTAETALQTLELAHRWQVDDVVRMVENFLNGLLTEATFEDIASRSQLLNLPTLKRACIAFAEVNSAIKEKAQSNTFNKAVMALLGCTPRDEHPMKKIRRML